MTPGTATVIAAAAAPILRIILIDCPDRRSLRPGLTEKAESASGRSRRNRCGRRGPPL